MFPYSMEKTPYLTLDVNLPNHSRRTAAEIELEILLACLEREGDFEPLAVFPYSMVKTPYLTFDANLQITQALPQQK